MSRPAGTRFYFVTESLFPFPNTPVQPRMLVPFLPRTLGPPSVIGHFRPDTPAVPTPPVLPDISFSYLPFPSFLRDSKFLQDLL